MEKEEEEEWEDIRKGTGTSTDVWTDKVQGSTEDFRHRKRKKWREYNVNSAVTSFSSWFTVVCKGGVRGRYDASTS